MSKHDHLYSLPIKDRYSDSVWRAINVAAEAHEDQWRKLSGQHYIVHPFGVLELVRSVTDDEATQQGAILHDTLEDTALTERDLNQKFGREVANIVWGVSKDKSINGWRQRNEAYLDRLSEESPQKSVVVATADKIDNMRDLIESHNRYGDKMWDKFSAGPDDQIWWYQSILEVARDRTPTNPLNEVLKARIDTFRSRVLGETALHDFDLR